MNLKISWIVANSPTRNSQYKIKALNPACAIWGAWSSWHIFMTDNIICHDHASAKILVDKKIYLSNKLFLPATFKIDFGTLPKVTYYAGDFAHEIDNREEIVAMHLAAANSDVVLLHGFDWSNMSTYDDDLDHYKKHCYKNLVSEAIKSSSAQWVLVDHLDIPFTELESLDNLTCDNLTNVKALISN